MNGPLTGSEPGLAGYWRLDEPIGSQTVLDQTANHNNGHLGSTSGVDNDDPTPTLVDHPPTLTSWRIDQDTGMDPHDKVTNCNTPTLTFTFSEAVFGSASDVLVVDPRSTPSSRANHGMGDRHAHRHLQHRPRARRAVHRDVKGFRHDP